MVDDDRTEARGPGGAVSARRLAADAGGRDEQAGNEAARGPGHQRPSLVTDPGAYQSRWTDIQAAFVDSPRDAVRDADTLVSDVIQQIVDGFTKERGDLEAQWSRGDEVSTEQLRVALQRYRSFFERLLST